MTCKDGSSEDIIGVAICQINPGHKKTPTEVGVSSSLLGDEPRAIACSVEFFTNPCKL